METVSLKCGHIRRPFDWPGSMSLDDHALLDGIGRGDTDAFCQFRERHAQGVYRAALGVLHDVQLAEEVAQDTFVSLWLGPMSYDASRGAALPWLLSVTRHRAIDRWRTEQRRPRRTTDSDQQLAALVAPGNVEMAFIDRERAQEVRARLGTLPASQMTAIALSYFGELTRSEVALHVGVSVGTVKGRVRLGLTRLRSNPE